jgi:hypothetical protein
LVNILILRLCNYDKSPDHVELAGKFTLMHKEKSTHNPLKIYNHKKMELKKYKYKDP